MNRFSNLGGRSLWLGACAASVFLSLGLSPSSSAAQTREQLYCQAVDENVHPETAMFCVNPELGLLAQLNMTSPLTARIALRHLQSLACKVGAFDELGSWAGDIVVTSDDQVVEDCFRVGGECFDFSPITAIVINCFHEDFL